MPDQSDSDAHRLLTDGGPEACQQCGEQDWGTGPQFGRLKCGSCGWTPPKERREEISRSLASTDDETEYEVRFEWTDNDGLPSTDSIDVTATSEDNARDIAKDRLATEWFLSDNEIDDLTIRPKTARTDGGDGGDR
ncbi:hypothetical protein [Haloarcula halophila]|uniref:hypothetical protein n=1 Tax=Haloarcula TaxID=2237 RepID=UPI0023E3A481|nr:hypothetical protein [Halomicroarcula sp. DFY41]